jgi:hypothetical protein
MDTLDIATATIDTSVTPDKWLLRHPTDSIGIRGALWSWSAHHENCRTAIGWEKRGTLRVRRAALFIVPRPPASMKFDDDTSRLAERRCELHSIQWVIATRDSVLAWHVADSLISAIAIRVGTAGRAPAEDPSRPVTRFARTWLRANGATVVNIYSGRAGPDNAVVGWNAVLEVTTTAGDYDKNAVAMSRDAVHPGGSVPTWSDLDSALKAVALPETRNVAGDLERLAPKGILAADTAAIDSVVLPAARALLAKSALLSPPRRAAALFAVDELVSQVASAFDIKPVGDSAATPTEETRRRTAYEQLGATYGTGSEQDDAESYEHTWLAAAYHADSLSAGGHLAFYRILGEDGQIGPGCSRNERYESVIELGEAGLRDYPVDSAGLERPLALAYADRLSMAMGLDTGTVFLRQMGERYEGFYSEKIHDADLEPIRALMPETRRRGFAHARAAFVRSRDPVDRAALWLLMFRAVAGIPGSITFFCMGD